MPPLSSAAPPRRCAYCQEPLRFSNGRPQAVPVGDQFVCDEFCEQALREATPLDVERAP